MLQLNNGEALRFVGLRTSVAYRIELGFAIVDDGERLCRIKRAAFEHVISDAMLAEDQLPSGIIDMIRQHPTVFDLYLDADTARRSLESREI